MDIEVGGAALPLRERQAARGSAKHVIVGGSDPESMDVNLVVGFVIWKRGLVFHTPCK